MSQESSFLKNTLDLLETDPEVKSYIYQQILDFNPFVTPETLVMVIARDPKEPAHQSDDDESVEIYNSAPEEDGSEYKYRIAIVLKDGESSIESEAFNDDIFDAIRLAKENLIDRLVEIQSEIESPQERLNAIKDASDNTQVH